MEAPKARAGIEKIDAYVPGKSKVAHDGPLIKLSSNETPLGASPAAIDAYRDVSGDLALYPDGSARELRTAIGERHGLDPDRIVCGAGSDELLTLLATAYLSPGDEAIYTEHGFLVYRIVILMQDAVPVVVPERDFTADVDAILAAVTDRTRMVFLANPNNPTGTYLAQSEMARLRAGLPDEVVLVIDGAYAEYVEQGDYDSGVALVDGGQNCVMTRTFSKLHGLAALRLGWAYCPEQIAHVLNKIRGPFNVTAPAIAAGAVAIADAAHERAAVELNNRELTRVSEALREIDLAVTPSVANFILVHFASAEEAAAADRYLQSRGIIVRAVGSYGLPRCLRITIGLEAQNDAVISALRSFRQDAASAA